MRQLRTPLLLCAVPWLLLCCCAVAGGAPPPAEVVVAGMGRAYEAMSGYQTETEVVEFSDGGGEKKKRFLYSFRKPRQFRIDMRSPNQGMVLIYSEADGKVVVRPGGIGRFMTMRLEPDSRLLSARSGQRIDQTDLGLLISNIGRSVSDQRRGEVRVTEEKGRTVLETLAADHFLPGVLTGYRFVVDRDTRLPVEVAERTPEGVLKRVVTFRALRSVDHFPEHFFDPEGKGGKE